MFYFLHSFLPNSILFSFGPLTVHWYGLFLVLGMAAGITVAWKLSSFYGIEKEKILDLAIWLIVSGLLGARIYELFLEFPYYYQNPTAAFKFWEGGLAIHGAIIGGAIALFLFAKRYHLSAARLGALSVTRLSLGQALGRWGNWFNQELFGLPTNLPWGIPIAEINRPLQYINETFFQPTFLYESLGCLLIFTFLLFLNYKWKNKIDDKKAIIIIIFYLIAYSLLRFSLEFIKVDITPMLWGWRWPQIMSLIIITTSLIYLFINYHPFKHKTKN